MLYGRRKRLRELEEAEAQGASFWTKGFDERTRTRLWALVELAARSSRYGHALSTLAGKVDLLLRANDGVDAQLYDWRRLKFYFESGCPDEDMPSVIEALLAVIGDQDLEEELNTVLSEQRISYELVNEQMVEFESKELHQEVVVPALRLLSGRPGWDPVEKAYQNALREISEGQPADAITDAGTALQEALTLLGCEGNRLGPLIQSARKKGLLAPHDAKLAEGIEKVAEWVSADRSTRGESHRGGTDKREDAWFTVHVVGALILRLAGGPRTG